MIKQRADCCAQAARGMRRSMVRLKGETGSLALRSLDFIGRKDESDVGSNEGRL